MSPTHKQSGGGQGTISLSVTFKLVGFQESRVNNSFVLLCHNHYSYVI